MSIPTEAIEAAARAIYDVRDDPYDDDEWEEMDSSDREECMCQARAALTAAAPAIQAAALREAADAADDPSPDEMDFYQIDQAQVGNWLRARADQLEGKTE